MREMHGSVPALHDYLHHSARRSPGKVALVSGGHRVTYGELEERSNALAHTLVARGIQRGDRVLLFSDNSVETVIAFWAVLKANAVVSIVNPLVKAEKLQYLVNDCRPRVLITDAHLYSAWAGTAASTHLNAVIFSGALDEERRKRVPRGIEWEEALASASSSDSRGPQRTVIDMDLAAIIYTSGSTGEPKGVMLSHRNMLAAATSISSCLEVQEDEVILCVLPLAFNYGLYQMIMAFRESACLVLERSFAFPAQIVNRIIEERVTAFPGVPTIFAILAEMKTLVEHDFSHVRYVTNTAAALPEKHIELLQRIFPAARIYSMYGLTECKRCTYLPPADITRKPGSVGIAIPNTELWLIDEDGNKVGPNIVGELVIRGATVMQGYWEKPEATARKLKPGPLPGERVLHTGDYCRLDDDGYLYFVGRMDDIIKCRGEKVAPKEVEAIICGIPGVREVAVIGVPDEVLGQAVKAFVVPQAGAAITEKLIQRACHAKLESFMVPKLIQIVTELPKTDTGKIRKTGLS
jgi:amino acid adenylation domain-containing protein